MTYTPGAGTRLFRNGVEVAQITKLTPPSSEMGTVETTTLVDQVRTFLATIRDSGEANATIEWDPSDSGHQGLWNAHKSGALDNYEIHFADDDDTVCAFDGILTKFPIDETDVDSVMQVPLTWKVSGDIDIS
jgi:hypothetical protein